MCLWVRHSPIPLEEGGAPGSSREHRYHYIVAVLCHAIPTRMDVAAGYRGSSAASTTKLREVNPVKTPLPTNSA